VTEGRSCGPCSVCCTVLGVVAIDKPDYCACPHEQDGCSIYDRRPAPCRAYQCLWLSGTIADDDCRPDLLGVVFSPAWSEFLGGTYIQAGETHEGTIRRPRAKALVAKLGERYPVILMRKRTRSLLEGSDEVRQKLHDALAERGGCR